MSLQARLIEVRNEVGSDAELARIAEVSRSNVHQWMHGDIHALKALPALNIQEKTGFSARWLVLGKGPKKTNGKADSNIPLPDEKRTDQFSTEQKLLAIIRAFQETDAGGRDAIWAAAKVAMRRRGRSKERHKSPAPTHN